jgi:hypothetical protein
VSRSWEWRTHKGREGGGVLATTSRPSSPISSSRWRHEKGTFFPCSAAVLYPSLPRSSSFFWIFVCVIDFAHVEESLQLDFIDNQRVVCSVVGIGALDVWMLLVRTELLVLVYMHIIFSL